MATPDDTLITRTDTVLHTDLDDAIAMMNIDTGEYYYLNPVASRIWLLLETPQSLTSICEALGAEFDVSPETCRSETEAFLKDLSVRWMIRDV